MVDGFLGRWSQRKQAVREGKPVDEPKPPATKLALQNTQQQNTLQPKVPQPISTTGPQAAAGSTVVAAQERALAAGPSVQTHGDDLQGGTVSTPVATPAPPPSPTLEDVAGLSPSSDFRPFVAREVAPEVRNAAMKKLFADPHYNVMDRLDIYIDDYSKPDPLPQSMLRKMVGAQFLNLMESAPAPASSSKSESDAAARPTSGTAPVVPSAEPRTLQTPHEQAIDPTAAPRPSAPNADCTSAPTSVPTSAPTSGPI